MAVNKYKIEVKPNKVLKYELKNNEISGTNAFIICTSDEDLEIDIEPKIVLNFDDITTDKINSFTEYHAKRIKSFVDKIKNIDTLYVCCDYGVSRSAAIAAAIRRYKKQNENIIWCDPKYNPNILVYKILCRELGLKNTKLRLKYKLYLNKKALKKAINKTR